LSRIRPAFAFLSVLALSLPASAQLVGRVWTHPQLGFKLTIPEGYREVPLKVDEKWIVAKFLSDKVLLSKDREYNHEHRALMRVIAFTEKAKKEAGVEVEEGKDNETFIGIGAVPYQGYKDYVKRHRRGFFFAKENPGKVLTEACLNCEVDINKDEPKLYLYSVVFRRPTYELAVEFEVLSDRKDQVEKQCRDALESVRFIAAEAATSESGKVNKSGGRMWTLFRSAWRKRPLAERIEVRRTTEQERIKAVRAITPADWKVSDSKNFLVLSHTDERFTERMTEGAELFRAWCEQEFGSLSDDYVRRGIVRLCRDFDEAKVYHFDNSGSTGWSLLDDDHEVVTYRDGYHGTSGQDVAYLFGDILQAFLQEKDSYVVAYTPTWLTWALDTYVSNALVKDKKLVFRVDEYARDGARDMLREGKLPKFREIVEMDEETFIKRLRGDGRIDYAATQALRYILGPGQKDKVFKDFLKRYFRAAAAAAEKHDADWVGDTTPRKEATTEEEEEKQAKERSSKGKDRRIQLQKEVNTLMFEKVTDKDWERLEREYEAFVKAGK
jgi:hypothetical protein